MTAISIVVGTYNRPDYIRTCVESVIRETKVPFKLYITDAGSDRSTIEYLESIASDNIIPIFRGEKLGQARAYNDVFNEITTPYTCWISDDNEIVNGGLDSAASILDGDKRIGMVALKVKDVQGPFVKAPYIGGVSKYGILNVNQGMLRTEVLQRVGGFSEAFRDYGIDPDLTAKVLLAGSDIVYTKDIAIHHHRLWEMDKSSPEYAKMQERQKQYMLLYKQTYRNVLGKSNAWRFKKYCWKRFLKRLGSRYKPNSKKTFLGLMPRDWNNIFLSRYISIFDWITHARRSYHLRQYAPKQVKETRT